MEYSIEERGAFVIVRFDRAAPQAQAIEAMLERVSQPGTGFVGLGAGVRFAARRFAREAFSLTFVPQDGVFQAVVAGCFVTTRDLFEEFGVDDTLWSGYAAVDYSLKVTARGLQCACIPGPTVPQPGPRRGAWDYARFAAQWKGRVRLDDMQHRIQSGAIRRAVRLPRGIAAFEDIEIPPTTVLCYGAPPQNRSALEARLLDNVSPVARVLWVDGRQALEVAREQMEVRGDRYLALVDAGCDLRAGWLDRLVERIEMGPRSRWARLAPCGSCTLFALAKFAQHERLGRFETLDEALTDFISLKTERKRSGRRPGLVSIVMLSWNAPQFTKIALDSIRAHTPGEYEIIIVDNGSGEETVEWLRTLTGVRIIYNPENRGYAGGNNQAIAAARGEYVVLLNNDVVVTGGWLEGLLRAFDRIPALGVSAPRSNKIAGNQIVVDADYANIEQMHRYAARRHERYCDRGYMTDRAIGLCLCIDRRVINEVGGIDERFGVGNYEDDDFCLRVRAAGYGIFVCDDVFIHHYGSQTFAANNVDWTATMRENWTKFSQKWDLPPEQIDGGYIPGPAIRRGFVRERHFVPLPAEGSRTYALAFLAAVRSERDWNEIGAFARRYVRAFDASDDVLFALAAFSEPGAQTIGGRVERLVQREGQHAQRVPDVEISDEENEAHWAAAVPAARCVRIEDIRGRSPSALRRFMKDPGARP